MEKNVRISYLFDFYGDILSEKQSRAVELYYNDDLSLGEIAEQFGISRQGVRDLLKRSETLLAQMEEKLGLASKFERMLEDIDIIREQALKMQTENELHNMSYEETVKCAKIIIDTAEKLRKRLVE
ncbi:MAG: YlxM family DNA-binding protein [Acutalibacteraceae bacterium]|nr:YlxM family DNA-binding protein [Acutalibacteraceae bacterium]